MSFDLDAYLARIAIKDRPAADAQGLERVQRAHRLAIAFEDLDIPLGRSIRIDPESVFRKLVTDGRGGYCFEQNRLFRDALGALGFTVRPLLARVWLGQADDAPPPPHTHALNLVTLDGEDWVADAGFGGSYAPPMLLTDGQEVASPDGAIHRLVAQDDGWMLERHGAPTDPRASGNGWQRQYGFTAEPVAEAALEAANLYTSTTPDTRFTTLKVVSIALPTGFASLTDRQYRHNDGTEATGEEIASPADYRQRLDRVFGLRLTDEEVETLWATM